MIVAEALGRCLRMLTFSINIIISSIACNIINLSNHNRAERVIKPALNMAAGYLTPHPFIRVAGWRVAKIDPGFWYLGG